MESNDLCHLDTFFKNSTGVGHKNFWQVLYEPIHFVMERKMIKNIKRLAEPQLVNYDEIKNAKMTKIILPHDIDH